MFTVNSKPSAIYTVYDNLKDYVFWYSDSKTIAAYLHEDFLVFFLAILSKDIR